ncbi:hypothetical protein R3P38DRAFT_2922914 [Favolaschia claudopus]|uniref:Uncharacterized protein n=1 Tax=Favolaschia claudopus TaxID=2862362 RepID=A0AAW0BW24_9AGAR
MPPSESSPLLSRQMAQVGHPQPSDFPTISETLLRLGDRVDRVSVEDVCSRNTADICSETAFRLLVLLELRARKQLKQKPSTEIWNCWAKNLASESDLRQLNEQVASTWIMFLDEYRTSMEIERVLWTSFLVSDYSPQRLVRVVDMLNADCPSQLISHDVVLLSLAKLWRHGPSRVASSETETMAPLGPRYDALCTPQALHFMELATHLAYFGLLVSYVMHPPFVVSWTRFELIGPREILLMVLSASVLIRPWTIFTIPFAMTLSIFLFSLPAVPFAYDVSFNILLLAFVFHTFQLHFSSPPSPLYLVKLHRSLPFVHFLAHGLYRIILPFAIFFAPIFILATVWLSMALQDTFLVGPLSIPTPMVTRTTVLFMFFTLIAAISSSLIVFITQGGRLDTDASGWDAYGIHVGLSARASFVRTVITYSAPNTFPAPFSLIHAVVIAAPSFVVRRLGLRISFDRAEKLLWRVTVGPVGLVCALVVYFLPS